WGLNRSAIGGHLVVPPLLFDVGAVGFGWLARRRDPRTTAVLLFTVATALATTLALVPLAPNASVALMLLGVASCGGGGVYVLATADMLARVPVDRTSSAGGVTAGAQSLAYIIA